MKGMNFFLNTPLSIIWLLRPLRIQIKRSDRKKLINQSLAIYLYYFINWLISIRIDFIRRVNINLGPKPTPLVRFSMLNYLESINHCDVYKGRYKFSIDYMLLLVKNIETVTGDSNQFYQQGNSGVFNNSSISRVMVTSKMHKKCLFSIDIGSNQRISHYKYV